MTVQLIQSKSLDSFSFLVQWYFKIFKLILVLVSHSGAIPNSKKRVLLIFRYTEYSPLKNCRQEECSLVYCLPDNCFTDERLPYTQYKCCRQIFSRTSACTIPINYKQKVHGTFHDTYITLAKPKSEII